MSSLIWTTMLLKCFQRNEVQRTARQISLLNFKYESYTSPNIIDIIFNPSSVLKLNNDFLKINKSHFSDT